MKAHLIMFAIGVVTIVVALLITAEIGKQMNKPAAVPAKTTA